MEEGLRKAPTADKNPGQWSSAPSAEGQGELPRGRIIKIMEDTNMTMTIEKKLRDFDFWSGAATNAAKLTPDELDQLDEMLDELHEPSGDYMSTTEVNDMMWFDFENVCDWLGLDYEEVMARE